MTLFSYLSPSKARAMLPFQTNMAMQHMHGHIRR